MMGVYYITCIDSVEVVGSRASVVCPQTENLTQLDSPFHKQQLQKGKDNQPPFALQHTYTCTENHTLVWYLMYLYLYKVPCMYNAALSIDPWPRPDQLLATPTFLGASQRSCPASALSSPIYSVEMRSWMDTATGWSGGSEKEVGLHTSPSAPRTVLSMWLFIHVSLLHVPCSFCSCTCTWISLMIVFL